MATPTNNNNNIGNPQRTHAAGNWRRLALLGSVVVPRYALGIVWGLLPLVMADRCDLGMSNPPGFCLPRQYRALIYLCDGGMHVVLLSFLYLSEPKPITACLPARYVRMYVCISVAFLQCLLDPVPSLRSLPGVRPDCKSGCEEGSLPKEGMMISFREATREAEV